MKTVKTVKTPRPKRDRHTCRLQECDPPGVQLLTTAGTPAASEVFSADEMDARVARYAARAAVEAPLFEGGPIPPAPEPEGQHVECWACGKKNRGTNNLAARGWQSRRIECGPSMHVAEVYCDRCFAQYGWPD